MKRGRALRLGHFDDAAECAVQHAVLQKRVCLPQHCLRSQGPSAALSKPIQETRKTCTGWKEYMVQLCRTGVGKGGNLGRPRGDAGPWACSNPKCTEGTDGSAQEGDCGLTQKKKKKKTLLAWRERGKGGPACAGGRRLSAARTGRAGAGVSLLAQQGERYKRGPWGRGPAGLMKAAWRQEKSRVRAAARNEAIRAPTKCKLSNGWND